MPDIGATMRALTLGINTVAATVSSRMYSDILITGAVLPALVYNIIDTDANETLAGVVSVSKARFQIDAYGQTRSDANNLAENVRIGIEKYRGSVGGQFIHEINLAIGAITGYDKDGPFYITTMDYFVTYSH